MKKYKFSTEITIEAETQEEAEEDFANYSCYDWDIEEITK